MFMKNLIKKLNIKREPNKYGYETITISNFPSNWSQRKIIRVGKRVVKKLKQS